MHFANSNMLTGLLFNWSYMYFEDLCQVFYIQFGPFPAIFIDDASLYEELEVINTKPEENYHWKRTENSVLTGLELADTVKQILPLLLQQLNTQQIQPTSGNPVLNFNFVNIFAVKAGKQGFILKIQQEPSKKVSPSSREWGLRGNSKYVLQAEKEEFPLLTAKKGQFCFTTKLPINLIPWLY